MKIPCVALMAVFIPLIANAQNRKQPELFDVPEIRSSRDDLTDGVQTSADWQKRRIVLRKRYLDLIRDQHKPEKPPLDLKVHEQVVVDGAYMRWSLMNGLMRIWGFSSRVRHRPPRS